MIHWSWSPVTGEFSLRGGENFATVEFGEPGEFYVGAVAEIGDSFEIDGAIAGVDAVVAAVADVADRAAASLEAAAQKWREEARAIRASVPGFRALVEAVSAEEQAP